MTYSNSDQFSSQLSTNSLVDSYLTASSSTTQTVETLNDTNNEQKTSQTIIGIFESRSDAERAVNSLRQQGFTSQEINIISKNPQGKDIDYDDDIADGTLTGSTLGGIGGLLLGTGILAIPGIAPIVALAGGPIAAAIGGAIAGGVAGGLIDWGIPADESQHYEEEVIEGSILAIIHTDSARADLVSEILRQNGAKEVKNHSKSLVNGK